MVDRHDPKYRNAIWVDETPPHPRWTCLDFLDWCPPAIGDLYAYWDGKRAGRPMPSRKDIDPVDMKPWLAAMMLVDVGWSPLHFTYRLVGTMEVAARGYDPTGKSVETSYFGPTAQGALWNYRTVAIHKTLVYEEEFLQSDEARLKELGVIFLPLSENGKDVNMIMVYTAFVPFRPLPQY